MSTDSDSSSILFTMYHNDRQYKLITVTYFCMLHVMEENLGDLFQSCTFGLVRHV